MPDLGTFDSSSPQLAVASTSSVQPPFLWTQYSTKQLRIRLYLDDFLSPGLDLELLLQPPAMPINPLFGHPVYTFSMAPLTYLQP
jgi:hypothetical protein